MIFLVRIGGDLTALLTWHCHKYNGTIEDSNQQFTTGVTDKLIRIYGIRKISNVLCF
jgi:hypothetical protein